MKKCKNCGENIDLFIGKKSKAKAYLHIIKVDVRNKIGYLWGWVEQNDKFCRNPKPK